MQFENNIVCVSMFWKNFFFTQNCSKCGSVFHKFWGTNLVKGRLVPFQNAYKLAIILLPMENSYQHLQFYRDSLLQVHFAFCYTEQFYWKINDIFMLYQMTGFFYSLLWIERSHCRACCAAVCVTCHVVANNGIKVTLVKNYSLVYFIELSSH